MSDFSAGAERRNGRRRMWRNVAAANGWVAMWLLLAGLLADVASSLWSSGRGGLEWNRLGIRGIVVAHLVVFVAVVAVGWRRPVLRQVMAPAFLVAAGALLDVSLHNLGWVP